MQRAANTGLPQYADLPLSARERLTYTEKSARVAWILSRREAAKIAAGGQDIPGKPLLRSLSSICIAYFMVFLLKLKIDCIDVMQEAFTARSGDGPNPQVGNLITSFRNLVV